MEEYNSRHTGPTIDDAIDRAKVGGAIDVSLAGKAPAGYGLGGGYSAVIADANNAIIDGKYATGPDTLNLPEGVNGYFGTIEVTGHRSDKGIAQTFIPGTAGMHPHRLQRSLRNGEWMPWEWVNPPMYVGVEYRTTERSEGNPVYAKRISYTTNGSVGNASGVADAVIAHGISNFGNLVRISGRNGAYPLPTITSSGGTASINQVSISDVILRTYSTTQSGTFVFDIYYTKTS